MLGRFESWLQFVEYLVGSTRSRRKPWEPAVKVLEKRSAGLRRGAPPWRARSTDDKPELPFSGWRGRFS
jgi:hypothetical protein